MSKITKLLKHPYAFFRDAAINRLNPENRPPKKGARYSSSFGLRDDARIPTYVFGEIPWKRHLASWFPEREFIFATQKASGNEFTSKLKKQILSCFPRAEIFLYGGAIKPAVRAFIQENRLKHAYVEEGFISFTGPGGAGAPPFSLLLDARTPHFNSEKASDLEHLLNEYDFAADAALLDRADRLMSKLLEAGHSKYNQAGRADDIGALYGPKEKRRILVLGHMEGSNLVMLAGHRFYTNSDLVMIAAMENPDAQIIYKPHPKMYKKQGGQFAGIAAVRHLCLTLEQDIPIAQALETVDHVYTVASLAGFEALIRGIGVTALGCPFYSGWGLTDDRQPNPRRKRTLSAREVFAAAYVLYPKYFDPVYKVELTPEAALDRLPEQRKFLPETGGVEIEEELTAFMFGFNPWKRDFIEQVFPEYKMHFIAGKGEISKHKGKIEACANKIFIIWGYKEDPSVVEYAEKNNIEIRRMEDGFIRSISLGAVHSIPYSLCLDGDTLYFDARRPSLLEDILNTYNFRENPSLLDEAAECIKLVLSQNVSKYNSTEGKDIQEFYGPKTGKRILVIGQVEDDASIRFGCSRSVTNNDLVLLARLENRDAEIFYKPHPDVINGHREEISDPKEAEPFARVIYENLSLPDALKTIDHVYTITSLSGFEALLRGIKVTTLGCPFYSGWGLTDDRQPNERRKRKLTVEELFAGAYLLYPHYFAPVTRERTTARKIIEHVAFMRTSLDNHLREKLSSSPAADEHDRQEASLPGGVAGESATFTIPLSLPLSENGNMSPDELKKIKVGLTLNLTARSIEDHGSG